MERTGADPLNEALGLVEAAREIGAPLRLAGGLAIRVLCPGFPPRVRENQDLDLASVSRSRPALVAMLVDRGYEPDRRFNALYGHKQLYFASPDGRYVDVLIDRLEMCHDLEFADRIERMPLTLDPTDLLLSKLQIVELNEKDVQDIVYLLAAFPVEEGNRVGAIGLDRIREIVGGDWGWWRTLTLNLDKIDRLLRGPSAHLIPSTAEHPVLDALQSIGRAADAAPKSLRWRIRARVGERRRWYRVPEETPHD